MKHFLIVFIIITISMMTSACGPGKIFGPTLTSTPTLTATPTNTSTSTFTPSSTSTPTNTPTITPSPTPVVFFTCEANDPENDIDAKQAFFDITKGTIRVVDDKLDVSLSLKDNPPDPFIINMDSNNRDFATTENNWGVYVDIDGNPKTGVNFYPSFDMRSEKAPGIEYQVDISHLSLAGSTKEEVTFPYKFTTNVTQWSGNLGHKINVGNTVIDRANKTMTLSVILPGLSENSKFYFFTLCMNSSCDYSRNWDTLYNVVCTNQK